MTLYFNTKYAITTHDWIIKISGGLAGNKEIGLLDSVLEHIQNDLYYPDFEDKLQHLILSVNKFHPFNDGNKRSSLVLAVFFLKLNGYDHCINRFLVEMENVVVWLAEGKITDELLKKIIYSLIYDDTFDESLKLDIFEAISE